MTKSIYDNYFWIPFRNDSSEDIPAYGSMSITGVVSGGARVTLTCDKTDSSSTVFATNGPFSVGAGNFGSACVSLHRVAKFTGSLAPGDRCKPKVADWVLEKDLSGMFVCVGVINTTDSLAIVIQDQITAGGMKLIKAPSGGIPGRVGTLLGKASCTVVTFDAAGQLSTTSESIDVYNWARFAACKNGDRYGVAGWANSAWLIVAEDCTDDGSTTSPQSMSASGGSFTELISFDTISPLSMITTSGNITATTPTGGAGTGGGFS